MKKILNFEEFVFENLNETSPAAILTITPIDGVKAGQKIWRLMDRYNPQLGTYYAFNQVTITRVNAKTISCDDNAIYAKENGKRQGKEAAGYGSAEYMIMSPDDAERITDELNKLGAKVRGFTK